MNDIKNSFRVCGSFRRLIYHSEMQAVKVVGQINQVSDKDLNEYGL